MVLNIPGLGKSWRKVTMKMQLDDLQAFIRTVENTFKKQAKASEKKWDRPAPKRLSNDKLEDYYQQLSREVFWLSTEFPSLVRQTTFIYLYSALEKALAKLCEDVHKGNPQLPPPSADAR